MHEMDDQFPTWMVVPPTLRLFTYEIQTNLSAIQELWFEYLENWQLLSSRCPNLQVLRSELNGFNPQQHLLDLLKARERNVKMGLEVDQLKIEPLKKLVIPFNELSAEALEECRELVEEVVD